MAIKLGEMLVQEGKITAQQLEEALNYQVIYGGKVGTNLIEMGLIDEEELAKALSRKLKIPFVKREHFNNVSAETLKLLPIDIVKKYRVFPLQLKERKLTLAMADPGNLAAIDEIAFRTGFVVRPVVAPEVRLILALEQYYDIPRETRYVLLSGKLASAPKKKSAAPAPDPEQEVKPAQSPEKPPSPRASAPPQSEPTTPEVPPAESLLPDFEIEVFTPEFVWQKLADAGNREDIADILAAYLGKEFGRCALFLVRGGTVSGWRATRRNQPIFDFESFQLQLDAPSVLKTVADSRSFYLGPIPDTPANAAMTRALGGDPPATALLVPLMMIGRVVCILFVEGGQQHLSQHLNDLQRLAAKASMAFEILVLRNKITAP